MKHGLFKKTAAIMLSMIMAFGAVSVLPGSVVKDNAIVASAEKDRTGLENYSINDCVFYYQLIKKDGIETACIEDVDIRNEEFKVEIPSTVKKGNNTYTVTDTGWSFLENNANVKSVIMPNTIVETGPYFCRNSSVEELVISDNLEYMAYAFCSNCPNLKRENVKYNGNKLKDIRAVCFSNCPGMLDEKGALCLKNWLVRYEPKGDKPANVRIAQLANDGVPIDSLAGGAMNYDTLTSVDLEGVKVVGFDTFQNVKSLTTVFNGDSVTTVGEMAFQGSGWLENGKESEILRLGEVLFHYKTDGKVIDLTSDKLAGLKTVKMGGFAECKNAEVFKCNSDFTLSENVFYVAHDNSEYRHNPLPVIPTHNIKEIYVDGEKMEFSLEKPLMNEWVKNNCGMLLGTVWIRDEAEAKTKVLLEQLDLPYYGIHNDKVGTRTPTEEFYAVLKVHEYMSTFDYDLAAGWPIESLLSQGRAQCGCYASLSNYLLRCSGVESMTLCSYGHEWNMVKIGDEWFECDMGWDEQSGHNYGWFMLSQTRVTAKDNGGTNHKIHAYSDVWFTTHTIENTDIDQMAKRTLGDLNGDDNRDITDANLLWDYIKGNISESNLDTEFADINFDGVLDITDYILLHNFVSGTAVDPKNYPKDALSPGFNVVFADNCELEDIDPADIVYKMTDRDGYIVLPELNYNVPEGKKFGGWKYSRSGKVAKPGEKVKISEPYTVIQPVWKGENETDDDDGKWLLGDVDGNNTIDIADVSMLINHINGVKSLDDEAMLRADVNKSNSVDISDASTIVNHINGVKALEGMV